MTVKCHPYYLLHEFVSTILAAVYIPLRMEVKSALDEVYNAADSLQTEYPEAFFIIAGNFNQPSLKNVATLTYPGETKTLSFKPPHPRLDKAIRDAKRQYETKHETRTNRMDTHPSDAPTYMHGHHRRHNPQKATNPDGVPAMHSDPAKMKELVFDSRKQSGEHTPVCINGTEVEMVDSIMFWGVMIINNLSWSAHVQAAVKKAQEQFSFLR
eukprot:g40848.t1